jgi:hypothetical protein
MHIYIYIYIYLERDKTEGRREGGRERIDNTQQQLSTNMVQQLLGVSERTPEGLWEHLRPLD